jgi:hypothetical protein
MFTDPSAFPLSSGSINLTRINQDGYSSEWRFQTSLLKYTFKVRHTKVAAKGTEPAKDRHNVEITRTTFAAGAVGEYSEKTYLVTEMLTSSTSVELPNALANWLIASTNAQLTKLINWEI